MKFLTITHPVEYITAPLMANADSILTMVLLRPVSTLFAFCLKLTAAVVLMLFPSLCTEPKIYSFRSGALQEVPKVLNV